MPFRTLGFKDTPAIASTKAPVHELVGIASAAGFRDRPRDVRPAAAYYGIPQERLERALQLAETSSRAEVALVQQTDASSQVWATAFFSSAWSEAYRRLANPYGRVHRDFHYQVLFVTLSTLAQAGCRRIQVENPMSGMPWRVDAYVCLREAWNNVRRHVANVRVMVQEGSLRPQTVRHVEGSPGRYELSEHRPVGISPHVLEGLNMMTVFVETAGVSAQMDRTRKWDVPASFQ